MIGMIHGEASMVTTQQNMNPIESMVGKSEKIHVNILMIW
jgi:hypothetical protein